MRFRTEDGGEIAGSTLIDRFWGGLVHWATVEQPRQVAAQQRALLEGGSSPTQRPIILGEFQRAAEPVSV